METLFRRFKMGRLISGIVLTIIAAVIIALSIQNVSNLSKTLSIIIACFAFLLAVVFIASSLLDRRKSFFDSPLLYGAILIGVGVVLIKNQTLLEDIIIVLMAVFALTYGAIEFLKGLLLIRYKAPTGFIIMAFVIAAIGIAFGIFVLVANPKDVLRVVYIFVGAVYLAFGITEIVLAIKWLQKK